MSEFFGYSGEKVSEYQAFNEGELVKCILLDCGLPMSYLKKLNEENEAIKEESKATDMYIPPKKASYKEGGLEWKYAVIARDKNTKIVNQKVFIETENGLEVPKISCYGQLLCPTPRMIHEKNLFSFVKGGGSKVYSNGGCDLIYMLPESSGKADWSDAAKDELEEEWKVIYEKWDALTEEEAKTMLSNMFARRMLLCRPNNENKYEYLAPETGMIFQAMIKYYTKYHSLVVIDRWDKTKKRFDMYSTFDVRDVSENSLSLAKELIQLREENKIKREKEKELAKEIEADDEPAF